MNKIYTTVVSEREDNQDVKKEIFKNNQNIKVNKTIITGNSHHTKIKKDSFKEKFK